MAPAALGVLLALAVGTGLAYGLFGTKVTDYDFSVCPAGDCEQPRIVRNVPFPLVDVALFGVGGLVALLVAVGRPTLPSGQHRTGGAARLSAPRAASSG